MSTESHFADVLSDRHFQRLLREMSKRSIPWDEFLGLPQPNGISPLDTWRLLSEVGRHSSIHIPVPDYEDRQYRYRRTHDMDDSVTRISCACQEGSRIHSAIRSGSGQQFLVRSQIEKAVATARLHGLALETPHAEELLRLRRKPRSATEQLLSNLFHALGQLEDLRDEPFSIGLFEHLHTLLAHKVDIGQLPTMRPMRGILPAPFGEHSATAQRQHARQQMQYMADYLNGTTAEPDDLTVVRGEVMLDAWRFYNPLGALSTAVGFLVANVYELKNNLPVLAWLPLSKLKLDWEEGLLVPPAVTYSRDSYYVAPEDPLDMTAYVTLTTELMVLALGRLEHWISQWEQRDDDMRRLLHNERLLNQRQRSILGRALRAPDAEFRIRYHQQNHGIHYTTARRDLLELMEKDYLVMEQVGKAFVFRRGPRLDELEPARMD